MKIEIIQLDDILYSYRYVFIRNRFYFLTKYENRPVTLQSTLQDCSPDGIANDYTDHQERMMESSLARSPTPPLF